MANPEFKYAPMFQLGEDKTEYRLISKEGVSVGDFEGHKILKVSPEALELLTTQAFHVSTTSRLLLYSTTQRLPTTTSM